MIKFSNNGNYKLKKEEAAMLGIPIEWLDFIMAFSHWTFAVTEGQAMVVDLQGTLM